MFCDMCGNGEAVYNAEIEGSLLAVCSSCAAYGNVKGRIRAEESSPKKKLPEKHSVQAKEVVEEPEVTEMISEGYAGIIKRARERKGLKQAEIAKILHEKESLIHSVESGKMQPNIPLARKLEKYFGVRLVEEYSEKPKGKHLAGRSESLTLGDIASVKQRKKP